MYGVLLEKGIKGRELLGEESLLGSYSIGGHDGTATTTTATIFGCNDRVCCLLKQRASYLVFVVA